MANAINDVVLVSGIRRFDELAQSNVAVAKRLQAFSAVDREEAPGKGDIQTGPDLDMGQQLVTLTRNTLETSLLSRALSAQLGLYTLVISEGKA